MSCVVCSRERKVVARGLCNACYQRWLKRGTTNYAVRQRSVCSVGDCPDQAVSHGLCDKHRQRMRKHGHLEESRPDDWGARHKHPLFNSWAHMRRHRFRHPMDKVWEEDFLQFVHDVGGRPTQKHKLFCSDDSKPIGPHNFVWKRAITERVDGEDDRTFKARRARVYRRLKPEASKGYDLKRHFGLSMEEYSSLLQKQKGECAICLKPETSIIRGTLASLAVDHCHTQGHIRALLCSKCNTGLGSFRDDPALLRAAASYLEGHVLPAPSE